MAYKLGFLLILIPALALGASIASLEEFIIGGHSCDATGTGTFYGIQLDGCTQAPCQVLTETNVDIRMIFSPARGVTSLRSLAYVHGEWSDRNLMSNATITQDLEPGKTYQITDRIRVPYPYRGAPREISLEIMDAGTRERIVCGKFDAIMPR